MMRKRRIRGRDVIANRYPVFIFDQDSVWLESTELGTTVLHFYSNGAEMKTYYTCLLLGPSGIGKSTSDSIIDGDDLVEWPNIPRFWEVMDRTAQIELGFKQLEYLTSIMCNPGKPIGFNPNLDAAELFDFNDVFVMEWLPSRETHYNRLVRRQMIDNVHPGVSSIVDRTRYLELARRKSWVVITTDYFNGFESRYHQSDSDFSLLLSPWYQNNEIETRQSRITGLRTYLADMVISRSSKFLIFAKPGSGKTTWRNEVEASVGYRPTDTDDYLRKQIGVSVSRRVHRLAFEFSTMFNAETPNVIVTNIASKLLLGYARKSGYTLIKIKIPEKKLEANRDEREDLKLIGEFINDDISDDQFDIIGDSFDPVENLIYLPLQICSAGKPIDLSQAKLTDGRSDLFSDLGHYTRLSVMHWVKRMNRRYIGLGEEIDSVKDSLAVNPVITPLFFGFPAHNVESPLDQKILDSIGRINIMDVDTSLSGVFVGLWSVSNVQNDLLSFESRLRDAKASYVLMFPSVEVANVMPNGLDGNYFRRGVLRTIRKGRNYEDRCYSSLEFKGYTFSLMSFLSWINHDWDGNYILQLDKYFFTRRNDFRYYLWNVCVSEDLVEYDRYQTWKNAQSNEVRLISIPLRRYLALNNHLVHRFRGLALKALYPDSVLIEHPRVNGYIKRENIQPMDVRTLVFPVTSFVEGAGVWNSNMKKIVDLLFDEHTKMDDKERARYDLVLRALFPDYIELSGPYLNRAGVKLSEIIDMINYQFDQRSVLDLAGAPGGFSKYALVRGASSVTMVTLKEGYVIDDSIRNNQHFNVDFVNGTGDLLDQYVQDALSIRSYDAILADGAVVEDSYVNYSKTSQLVVSETLIGICSCAPGGLYVCKVFLLDEQVQGVIYLCGLYFRKILLVKPKSSRWISSELYLVCMDRLNTDADIRSLRSRFRPRVVTRLRNINDITLKRQRDSIMKIMTLMDDTSPTKEYVAVSGHLINLLMLSTFWSVDFRRYMKTIEGNAMLNYNGNRRVPTDLKVLLARNLLSEETSGTNFNELWHSYYDFRIGVGAYLMLATALRFPVNIRAVAYVLRRLKSILDKYPSFGNMGFQALAYSKMNAE